MEAVPSLQKTLMDTELLKALLDAGIGVISFIGLAYLFILTMRSHKTERREWKESSEKEREEWRGSIERQSEKVSKAIEDLAHSINSLDE